MPKLSHQLSAISYQQNSPKGFTLIELLVAISIVAVLATIGLVIFGQTQQNARDAKRRGDIKAIVTVLEQVYQATGSYPALPKQSCTPTVDTTGACPATAPTATDLQQWTNRLCKVTTGSCPYIGGGSAPVDPFNNTRGSEKYTYFYDTANNQVCAWRLEASGAGTSGVADFCLPLQQD